MKRGYLLLLFPMLGLLGMLLILSRQGDEAAQMPPQTLYPTPAPILFTPRPTVTILPVLGNPPPDAPLQSLEGEPFSLADYIGQPMVLNFWATWCEPCTREMPLLNDYAAAHPDLTVMALTDPDDAATSRQQVADFIQEYDLAHIRFGADARSFLQLSMNAMQIPTTFILDGEGVVRFRHIGELTAHDLDVYLGELP